MLETSLSNTPQNSPFDLARRAFTSIAAISGVSSLSELNNSFRNAVQELGYTLFACLTVTEVSGRFNVHFLYGDGLEPWWRYYLDMGYGNDDPVLGECLKTSDPFYWSELRGRSHIPRKALRIIDDARDHNLSDGFVVPLRRSGGTACAALLAGECGLGHDLYVRAASEFAGITYERIGRQFQPDNGAPRSADRVLTPRQRECLIWVRRGKTAMEIATIIGISHHVVNEHISEACRRLGVHKRTEAAITAAAKGHLDP